MPERMSIQFLYFPAASLADWLIWHEDGTPIGAKDRWNPACGPTRSSWRYVWTHTASMPNSARFQFVRSVVRGGVALGPVEGTAEHDAGEVVVGCRVVQHEIVLINEGCDPGGVVFGGGSGTGDPHVVVVQKENAGLEAVGLEDSISGNRVTVEVQRDPVGADHEPVRLAVE